MRILLVITGLKMGGAENQICDLADRYCELGHDVLLISLLDLIEIRPNNKDVKLKLLKLNNYNFIFCFFKFIFKLKKFKPDVVHSNLFHAIIFSRLSRLFVSIPNLICTHHGMHETTYVRRLLFRITDFLVNVNTAVSESSAKAFIESSSGKMEKVKVVYNGIDLTNFRFQKDHRSRLRSKLKISKETKVLLSVGRLVWEKDYKNLLDSFNMCLSKNPNLYLIIIGDGPQKRELILHAKNINILNKINFLGKRNDTKLWYSVADIFVSSSKREGFGLAIIEAIACKRQVVATKCGIVSKFPKNLIKLSKIMNSDELSKSILDAISKNKSQNEILIDKSYDFVKENFSLSKIVSSWISIYSNEL